MTLRLPSLSCFLPTWIFSVNGTSGHSSYLRILWPRDCDVSLGGIIGHEQNEPGDVVHSPGVSDQVVRRETHREVCTLAIRNICWQMRILTTQDKILRILGSYIFDSQHLLRTHFIRLLCAVSQLINLLLWFTSHISMKWNLFQFLQFCSTCYINFFQSIYARFTLHFSRKMGVFILFDPLVPYFW